MTTTLFVRRAVVTGVLLLLVALPTGPALAQPPNDAFGDAAEVAELPFSDSVDLTGASTEPGEPTSHCAPVAGSVWYAVRLDRDAVVEVDTAGSTGDTVLGVFEGDTLDSLRLVHCNDDAGDSPQAALALEAFRDLTVYVQAGVFGDSVPAGSQLEISFVESIDPPPPPVKGNRPSRLRFGERIDGAIAEWAAFTDTSMVITSLAALDGMWYGDWGKGHRGRGENIVLFHTHKELNHRTGETVRTEYESFAGLPPKAFTFDPSMRTATLAAEVETFAYRCVTPPGGDEDDTTCTELGEPSARLDIRWQGQGEVFRDRWVDRHIESAFRLWTYQRFVVRDAVADGTITIEGVERPVVDRPTDVFSVLLRAAGGTRLWWRD